MSWLTRIFGTEQETSDLSLNLPDKAPDSEPKAPKTRAKRPTKTVRGSGLAKTKRVQSKRQHGAHSSPELTHNGQNKAQRAIPGRFQQTSNTADNALTAFNRVPVSRDANDRR